MKTAILVAFILFPLVSTDALAEELTRDQLSKRLSDLEQSVPEIDRAARKTLQELGSSSQQQYINRRDRLGSEFKEWDEKLDIVPAEAFDIEIRRKALKQDVKLWTSTVVAWSLEELQSAVADAQVIAESDGLDIIKLRRLYELTKHIIRTADFIPTNSANLAQLDSLNLTTSDRLSSQLYSSFWKLWGLGILVEESEARARARHQQYRLRLYKRAVIAYIRALISGDEEIVPCRKTRVNGEAPVDGGVIKLLECPDPVVEKLRKYAQAVQTIQSADTEMFKAEVGILIAEQQLASDIMSTLPFVGEALDLWAVYTDTDIAGQCVSTEEQVLAGIFLALPIMGDAAPFVMKQIEKRSPATALSIEKFKIILNILSEETGSALTYAYREMKIDLYDRFAARFGTSKEQLAKTLQYLTSYKLGLDDAAKAELVVFRTVREAAEARYWRDVLLAPSVLREARGRAVKNFDNNLGRYQMRRSARVNASNLVADHVPVLEELARARDEVLVIRYVNEAATDLIAAGAGTKHMGIKAKSASRGPVKALIPVNQALSKQGSRLEDLLKAEKIRPLSQAEIDEITELRRGMASGEESLRECLQDPDCAGVIEFPVKNPLGEGDVILYAARDKKKGRHVFFVRGESGQRLHYKTGKPLDIEIYSGYSDEAVKVLADPKTGVPITADYDFLGLGVSGRHGRPGNDPKLGYVTEQIDQTIKAVNEAIGETQRARGILPQPVTHHGTERWYPLSPGALDVDPFVSAIDPKVGLVRIPRCDTSCMRAWCKNTKSCNPAAICGSNQARNCIPPDPDRLLKDYYHLKRLERYDLSPNSAWSWGHYNVLGGWSYSSYLESFRQKQIKARLARENGKIFFAPSPKYTAGDLRTPIKQGLFKELEKKAKKSAVSNLTQQMMAQSLPKCEL